MNSFFLIFICCCLIFSILKFKNIYNPTTAFLVIWCMVLFLFSKHLYNLPDISNRTYYIIYIGITSFLVGSFLGNYLVINKRKSNKNDIKISSNILNLLMFSAILVFMIPAIKNIIFLLQGGSFETIRYVLRKQYLEDNKIFSFLLTYYALPISQMSILVGIVNFFNERVKLKTILLLVILTFFRIIFEGGRSLLVEILIYTIVAILLQRKVYRRTLKKYFKIFFISVMMILVFSFITLQRNVDFIKSIYIYICGSIRALDIHVNTFDQFPKYSYGCLSLLGFIYPLVRLIPGNFTENILFLYDKIDSTIYLTNTYDSRYNSFVTSFLYFYFDFGILGVGLFSFIFGYIMKRLYLNVTRFNTIHYKYIYTYMFGIMIFTFNMFAFSAVKYALALVYLLLLERVDLKIKRG